LFFTSVKKNFNEFLRYVFTFYIKNSKYARKSQQSKAQKPIIDLINTTLKSKDSQNKAQIKKKY